MNKVCIGHLNIRGLFGKIDSLCLFVKEYKFDIFGISETLLNDFIPSALVYISGYNFERRDREKIGGGVGVYIKSSIDYVRRMDLENDELEFICLEILPEHANSYFVCVLYRPPNSSKHLHKDFIETFDKNLSKIKNSYENKETIIIGNINCNYLLKHDNNPFKDLLLLNGFIQTITAPTRIASDSESLIDVVLSNKPEVLVSNQVLSCALSDHQAIYCVRKTNNNKKREPPEIIKCRDYSNYSVQDIQKTLEVTVFTSVYSEKNPNKAWIFFKLILLNIFNIHAPLISKRVKGKKSPWLTRDVKNEMNLRDKFHRKFLKTKSIDDFNQYKTQRNKVNILVRKAKNKHLKTLLTESTRDPNRFWKTLKKIFPTKDTVSNAKSFLINGRLISNPAKIASGFCNFFLTMAKKAKEKSILLKDFVWSKPVISRPKTYSTFRFKEVLVSDVFKYLKKLSRNKSAGHDDLPPGMLKDSARLIAKPLAYIINVSLKTSTVPKDFKCGIISPIFKSGSKVDLDNYRPITLLPVCSKIFEKCVHSQLSSFLEEKKLLSSTQFGFRKQRNTETAATLFLDQIRMGMNDGQMTGAIFIDLTKAFDTLSHAQIIENLSSYGIHGKEKDLITDYLFNRMQTVRFRQELSKPKSVTCGVPQGSVLGPLLFLLTFNDIESVLKHSKIFTYADDTVIYFQGKTKEIIENRLTEDFQLISDWLKTMDLVCNMKKGKTEVMLFGTLQKTKRQFLNIQYNFQCLSSTDTYKYLGIKLDKSLSLKDHIDSAYKKAAGRLYLLNRVRTQLTSDAALTLYKSLILPIFTYCSILTCTNTRSFEEKLMNFEKRAARIIFKRHTVTERKKVSICTIQKRRICVQVYKCISGNVCSNLLTYFDVMANNTRNSKKLIRLPSVKLESAKKSFKFAGAKEYNSLPIEVRSATSTKEFIDLYNSTFNI